MTEKSYPHSTLPLDLGQLNVITKGKSTFQEELLDMFFSNVEDCLIVMCKAAETADIETWESASEELRHVSDSLGALELSKVCAVAQKMSTGSEAEKIKMLAVIRSNVQKLRVFIRNTRY